MIYPAGGDKAKSKSQLNADAFKGEVDKREKNFPKDLGEEHPFDFERMERIYEEGGAMATVVDKYIDHIWGLKWRVNIENENAGKIIEDWREESDFHTEGKTWVKEACLKGTGFLELASFKDGEGKYIFKNGTKGIGKVKVLNANHMYIKRDEFGNIKNFYQYVGGFKRGWNLNNAIEKKEVIVFEPDEIAIITINKIGSCPYGYGIVYRALQLFDNMLCAETELHTLIKRKANEPIIITLGDMEKGIYPTLDQIEAYSADLEYLNNKHEWVVGAEAKFSTLNFSNFGAKFTEVFGHDEKMFCWATQVPEVIMGSGNVPEGLAKAQRSEWQLTIASKQEDIEPVIRNQILRRVLRYNGLDLKPDIIWNEPSQEEITAKTTVLIELLKNPLTASVIRKEAQIQIAKILEFENVDEIETLIDEEEDERKELRKALLSEPNNPNNQRGKEERAEQPKVPGNKKPAEALKHKGCLHCSTEEDYHNDYELSEWLSFNYLEFIRHINIFIDQDSFQSLLAKSEKDLELGKFSTKQIYKLKLILKDGFNNNYSIKEFEAAIRKGINPPDAYRINKDNEKVLAISSEFRSNAIARTETTRVATGGALDFYKDNDVERVSFVASLGTRTCEECAMLNGIIYTITEADGVIPVHNNCRCVFVPVPKK